MHDKPKTKTQLMAERRRQRELHEAGGFDVVCTIGRVNFDETGDMTPFQAAMQLIAEHDSDGVYTFPSAWGGVTTVTVNTESEPTDNGHQTAA